ncbi:ABC transporter substrate-binding protein [Streptomyces sp. NPDC006678]|uniref:ABC transporter substrate-binding protein n=1 Tax=Streptomyces sp. NPDC006678 TaxID=3157185 RepID=UPI0033FF3659
MRHPARLGIALTIALSTAGCSASTGPSAPADRADTATAGVTTVMSCGRKLTFDKAPERAVTLDQNATETLLELGLTDRMAGTSNLKTRIPEQYRAAYARVPVLNPRILTGEQLRAAGPDVVVASFADLYTKDRAGTREELGALELPAYTSAVDCPERSEPGRTPFDLLFDDYRNYGRIFGVEDRAAALAKKQRTAVEKAAATAAKVRGNGARKPTVVWVYSVFNGAPYVAGRSGMPSAMSAIVGARNAFDDVNEDWPEVTWEEVARRDPDFIVLGDLSERGRPGDSAEEKRALMREDPVVSQLKAVRENRIIEAPGIEMDPSVRSVHTLELLAKGMKDLGHAR